MGNLTKVTIDFPSSHLIFPTIIGISLLLMGVAIIATRWRTFGTAGAYWAQTFSDMDKPRFFGGIGLTLLYFLLMLPVGDFWPNTGLGFLLCSVPYLALIGFLFLRERTRPQLIALAIVSIVAPLLVWWIFSQVFFLTLP